MPDPSSLPSTTRLTVYGYDWCDDTTHARETFDAAGVSYSYVNMDLDAAVKAVVQGAGYGATPVIVTPTGAVLMEPTDDELEALVRDAGH